ncbi:MAG TPA: dihydrofolate reductase family protein [Actinomycetota bacterium]|jgi:dihydrofolate reductase|nr:dihydrofolate reductase family protein [Actinomycetota bacterium]
MGKTQYYTATSIDGFIADEHHSLEWLFQVPEGDDDVGHEERFARFFGEVGAMAMGSTTYEWVLEHEQLLDHPEKWREYYGATPCWVFSHRELPAITGADLRFVQGQVAPVHREMVDAADGRNIWLVGGGELVGRFADAGLLDEIQLDIAPVTLGAGAPLLPRRLLASDLTLVTVERRGQFVGATYRVGPTSD